MPSKRYAFRHKTPCRAPGCSSLSTGLSIYCNKHHRARLLNGDPLAKAIRKGELRTARRAVRKFLKIYANHQAMIDTIDWINKMMDSYASRGEAYASGRLRPPSYVYRLCAEMFRLRSHGCTALEVFEEIATVFYFTQLDPRRLPRHSDQHHHATARLVLNLRHRFSYRRVTEYGKLETVTYRPSTVLLRTLGSSLNRNLMPVLVHMCTAITATEHSEAEFKNKLVKAIEAEPFKSPTEEVA